MDEVVYQTSLVEALNQNLGKITLGLAVLVAVLLFISFVLMANTVRLDLFSRRFSIHTMQTNRRCSNPRNLGSSAPSQPGNALSS